MACKSGYGWVKPANYMKNNASILPSSMFPMITSCFSGTELSFPPMRRASASSGIPLHLLSCSGENRSDNTCQFLCRKSLLFLFISAKILFFSELFSTTNWISSFPVLSSMICFMLNYWIHKIFRLKKWHMCHFFSLRKFDFRLIHPNSSLSCNILGITGTGKLIHSSLTTHFFELSRVPTTDDPASTPVDDDRPFWEVRRPSP